MGKHTNRLQRRFGKRGPKEGYCVLCREYGVLSRDHVPPAACGNKSTVIRRSLEASHLYDDGKPHPEIQGGSHYRTLCRSCNSLLGSEYDTELKSLYDQVAPIFRATESGLFLPPSRNILVSHQRLARCILGHLLAAALPAAVKSNDRYPFDTVISDYVLDPEATFPESLDIFYWYYPYRPTVAIGGMGKAFFKAKVSVTCSVLKFTPFAFWVVYQRPKRLGVIPPRLIQSLDMPLDQKAPIHLDFQNLIPCTWPEMPLSDEISMTDNLTTFVSSPR